MPLRMAFNSCVFDHPRHSACPRYHFRSSLASAASTMTTFNVQPIFISPIEITHLAHVARGKACAVREIRLQKLCRCDRRALFRALTDGFTDGADFIHLRKFSGENFRKFSVHDTVIGRFFNVHGFSYNLRCRACDVLLFHYISTVFRTLTRFSSQGLNGKYEACFVEVNFIST